jgi:hypothetical protein
VLLTKYNLGDEVEKNEMKVRHIAHVGKRRNAYIALVRNPEKRCHLKI